MTTYRCPRCKYKGRSIGALGAHMRKKHPGSMKRKKKSAPKRTRKLRGDKSSAGMNYCPCCGRRL